MNDDDDDFFIPTGEELDRMEVEQKPRKRHSFFKIRDRRASKRAAIDVPNAVGNQRTIRTPGKKDGDELLDKSGSTGRVVRSVDASDVAAKRELIIPAELREKYGLDEWKD